MQIYRDGATMQNVTMQTDILVVGGGMSGCCAALAAARQNRRVTLVDKAFYLGGIATQVQFGEMNSVKKDGKALYRGVFQEILDQLVAAGDGEYYLSMPMSSNPHIKTDRIRYNAEVLKLILDRLMLESGVRMLFGCAMQEAFMGPGDVRLIVGNRYNRIELDAAVVIDATGNAEVADALGYPTLKPARDRLQTATTAFHLTNVDTGRVRAFIDSGRLTGVIRQGLDKGFLQGGILSICPIPKTSNVAVNATRAERVDHESIVDVSEGLLESRRQISVMIPFLRRAVDGMENAVLSYISSGLGIRDRRRIVGNYTLTGADLIGLRDFADAVAVGAYPIDIHGAAGGAVSFTEIDGIYKIPYSSMIPAGAGHLIAAGRAISADDDAFAALRVIPIVSHIGEAAGHAAHLAIRDGVPVGGVNIQELQRLQHIL